MKKQANESNSPKRWRDLIINGWRLLQLQVAITSFWSAPGASIVAQERTPTMSAS
jgi:hypothetical protein